MLSLRSTVTYLLRRSIFFPHPCAWGSRAFYPPRFSSPFHCTRSSPLPPSGSRLLHGAPSFPFFLLHASANPAHRERGGLKGVTPPSLSPSSCRPVAPPPPRPSPRSPPRSTTSLQGKASRRGPRETRCAAVLPARIQHAPCAAGRAARAAGPAAAGRGARRGGSGGGGARRAGRGGGAGGERRP